MVLIDQSTGAQDSEKTLELDEQQQISPMPFTSVLFASDLAQMLLLFKETVIKDERQKSEKRDLFCF